MKIYLSGPISNNPIAHQLFAEAEHRYGDMGDVINPLNHNNIDTEWITAMRNDIALLIQCDTIVMLHGWEKSKGAQIEHFIAQSLNFNIIYDSYDYAYIIIETICNLAGKTIDDLKSRSRKQDIVFLRHIICYILHKKGFSLSHIGLKLNRNHATVLHSIRVTSDMLTYPNPLNELYHEIIKNIKFNTMENLNTQIVEPAYEITPLLVIFYSLGGYSAEKRGEKTMSKAKEAEKLLSNFLRHRNLIITIDGNGRLIFAEKS